MRPLRSLACMLVLSLALAALPSACSRSASQGQGHGTVQGVDADAREITLDHGDIPGLMKAMTMTFDVAPEVALEGLEPGVEVDFQVKYEGGAYVVTELRRSGS